MRSPRLKQTYSLIGILMILVLMSTAATGCAAFGNKVYAKVGLSKTKSDKKSSQFSGQQDHSDTGGQIAIGWKPIKYLGFEAAYVELGESRYNGYWTIPPGDPVPTEGTIDRSAIRASVVGTWPINDRWSVFAKGGMARWDVDETETYGALPTETRSADGTDPVFGAGVGFKLNRMIGFHGEYERFIDVGDVIATGQVDVDLITGSVVISF